MSTFVLDNSVSMRWLLASQKPTDQKYAEKVLSSLEGANGLVPSLWHLEAANTLLRAEKAGEITISEVQRFIPQLEALPLRIDTATAQQVFSSTMGLSRTYKLSSYDGAYLELAIREGLPLATLDKDMAKAAKKAGVEIYLK